MSERAMPERFDAKHAVMVEETNAGKAVDALNSTGTAFSQAWVPLQITRGALCAFNGCGAGDLRLFGNAEDFLQAFIFLVDSDEAADGFWPGSRVNFQTDPIEFFESAVIDRRCSVSWSWHYTSPKP